MDMRGKGREGTATAEQSDCAEPKNPTTYNPTVTNRRVILLKPWYMRTEARCRVPAGRLHPLLPVLPAKRSYHLSR